MRSYLRTRRMGAADPRTKVRFIFPFLEIISSSPYNRIRHSFLYIHVQLSTKLCTRRCVVVIIAAFDTVQYC
jgi:hypothetical protein